MDKSRWFGCEAVNSGKNAPEDVAIHKYKKVICEHYLRNKKWKCHNGSTIACRAVFHLAFVSECLMFLTRITTSPLVLIPSMIYQIKVVCLDMHNKLLEFYSLLRNTLHIKHTERFWARKLKDIGHCKYVSKTGKSQE